MGGFRRVFLSIAYFFRAQSEKTVDLRKHFSYNVSVVHTTALFLQLATSLALSNDKYGGMKMFIKLIKLARKPKTPIDPDEPIVGTAFDDCDPPRPPKPPVNPGIFCEPDDIDL